MRNEKCMVCISTRQNTANLIPFLQFNLDTMIILETDHAKKENWSEGLRDVLKYKNKNVKQYTIGAGTNLQQMLDYIRDYVSGQSPVCWNIGGGQKMQQMAMTRVFQERLNQNFPDWACYADPGTRKIFTITGDMHNLQSTEDVINTQITIDDVLTVFGLEKRQSNHPLLLWRADQPDNSPPPDIFRDISLFWNSSERRKIIDWVMTGEGDTPDVLVGLKHDYADYFEQVVQAEVIKILQKTFPDHHVTEAWANVRVKDTHGKEIAEWDIVLVTDFGTLIILDAKTGTFHSKDEHARLFNLERATGVYGEFWLVIPYLLEDIQDENFYAKYEKGKDIRKIPFDLSKLNSRFLAITGCNDPFYIKKGRKNKVTILQSQEGDISGKNILKITDLSALLDRLRLKKTCPST